MLDNRTLFRPEYLKDGATRNLGWNVPLESSFFIHPHWRQFEAPPIYWHVFFFLIFFCLMIASTFGNGIVIWIFTTSKSLRTPSNMLVVNLAIFDFIMMLDMPMFLVNTYNQSPIGGGSYCDVYATFGSISGIGAAITNAAIALDRYKTISNPMEGRMSMTKIFCIIIFTWLWTIPFTVLPLMKAWGQFAPEGFLTTCTFDYLTDTEETRVFVYAIFVWSYFIPMVLICYFYFKLFLHVQAHEKMLKDQAKKMNIKSLAANASDTSVEIRIAKIAFTIYFLFICAWTPYGIVTLIPTLFGTRELITPMVSMIPGMACKSVSCIDPWVYAISHPRYRKELEKRVPWLGIIEKSVSDQEDKSINTTAESANN